MVFSDFPVAKAKSLSAELFLTHPCRIPIESIACYLNLVVREVDLEGCDGRLVCRDRCGIVSVNKNIREIGRRRWTIAHEIGHYLLHKSKIPFDVYSEKSFLSNCSALAQEEREANCFAAELLLPSGLMQPWLDIPPSFKSIEAIAKEFQTTLTGAAMRLVELTNYQSALVYSQDQKVRWNRTAACFKPKITPRVLDTSYAFDLHEEKKYAVTGGRVFAGTWFTDQNLNSNAQITEESVYYPSYNSVLSLLYADKDVFLEEEAYGEYKKDDFKGGWGCEDSDGNDF